MQDRIAQPQAHLELRPEARRSSRGPVLIRLAAVSAVALAAANCAPGPAGRMAGGRTLDPKYGVYASPRVVEEGEPVPKGGGRDMVGNPYQVAGRTYIPRENPRYSRIGLASWYGSAFHGRLTANGEVFDRMSVAAAHTTMPLPSYARVTNLQNNRSMIVRVNDRGPYHANRVMDVSEQVAQALDFRRSGTARVKVDYIGRASLNGSDDAQLMATLRDDGPARLNAAPAQVAQAPRPVVAPTALAFRRTEEPAAEPGPFAALAQAVAAPAVAAPAEAPRQVANAPLPPERPFNLGTISGRSVAPRQAPRTPVAETTARERRALAVLFFAANDTPASGFSQDDPFAAMRPQAFIPLGNNR